MALDLGPRKTVRTVAYNGQVPGPILRVKEGHSFTVDVSNDTPDHELVHWHGLHIPPEVDGAHEEGTPPVASNQTRRYTFIARPAGTRWYHSHNTMTGKMLHRGTYTGQFGLLLVEPASDPGRYDLEVPLMMHEWEPELVDDDIEYKLFSINGKMLGAGEPVRVRPGQRVLFRIVNASATTTHRIWLPLHSFQVLSLDGNDLPKPATVPVLELGPAERVDAIVEMDHPGVWMLASTREKDRAAGMGVVVEYADQQGPPRWSPPPPFEWDYTLFGETKTHPEPDGRFPMEFKENSGSGKWTINGKSYPHTEPLRVKEGRRYRLIFDNQSAMAHPVHLHRHTFEITRFVDKPTSGVFKDVVMVPGWKKVEVDLVASNPGPSLFHCHQQLHMDRGFMTLMQYSD
ncbi:MAG TPA: multicopper oxidase family protein [Bryobacteraceae bacterium]|nr:multicopper oxidase family protein [Bryobacteraceae bacterium]